MLRTVTARLAAPRMALARPAVRPLSRSAPAYIRIKKADGSKTMPGDGATGAAGDAAKPKADSKPSPADQPSSMPSNVSGAKPFDPEVLQQGTEEARSASETPESKPLESAVPPSEPPSPEKLKAEAGASAKATPAETEVPEEIPDKPDLSKLPSLDIDPEANAPFIEQPKETEGEKKGTGKRGAGGRKQPQYVSSIERQRRMMSRLGVVALLLGGVGAAYYLGAKEGKQSGNPIEDFKNNVNELGEIFSKPAFKKLLPDPLPPPHQRPYTLLIDLEDILVHSTWDRKSGWRTAKRPGVDYFLGYLSQFYEIVLFTTQPFYTGAPVAEKLDPLTIYLPYKLFRDVTSYADGHVVKDLTYLNRDLSKVVMIDTVKEHASLQPDNALILPPWDGKPGDKGLVEIIPFLESIAIYAPADVRPVLKHYAGKDIPREYAIKEAEAKAAAVAEWERTHPQGSGSSWMSSMFGGGGGSQRPQQPMTYLEIKRQQAQRAYEEEQKYYRDHKAEILRMIEEDKERQMAEIKGSVLGVFGGGGKPEDQAKPEQQQQQQQTPAA